MKKITILLTAAFLLFALSSVKPLEQQHGHAEEQPTISAAQKSCKHGCGCALRSFKEQKTLTETAEPPKRLTFVSAEELPLVVEIGKTTVGSGENPAAVWKWLCGAGTKDNDDYSGSCGI